MFGYDDAYGYSTALLAVAPLATQLALTPVSWIVFFPLFAIPAASLILSVGNLSTHGPVLTYRRLAPIASGLGWALTWHVAERLYVEGLRAAQNLLYFVFSLRFNLDWAVKCEHSYNSRYCINFDEKNVTVRDFHHSPENHWPAQEFNSYVIRGNDPTVNISPVWEPNEWYLGNSKSQFFFTFPSLPLMVAHALIWTTIYFLLVKFSNSIGTIISRVFVTVPFALYIALIMGMSVSGFHFGMGTIEKEISQRKRDDDPLDYWIDVRGFYRASILAVDYSGAFSGLLLFATSRLRPGAKSMNALYLLPMMLPVPMLLTILRSGCEGHVAEQQPAYTIYASTDETISFDLLPVCFATSKVGPLWAAFYYAAQFLYTSMGPMIVYVSFIYESFVDDAPTVQNFAPFFFALIVTFFAVPSVLLYMPLGTKITALFHYTSESSIIQILCYIVIYFVYGWQTVESDILITSNESNSISLIQYLTRPTSPVYTVLMFTLVPALLCAKFTSVFDLLMRGNDVLQHIDAGTLFIPGPMWIRRIIGYGIMFAPTFIVIGFASYTMYAMMVRHRLPFRDLLKPTSDWMVHTAVNTTRPRPQSLAYGLYNSLCNVSYETAFFGLFVIEIFFGIAIFCLSRFFHVTQTIVFLGLNTYRLMLYIGVATMETAMLNGYMWMYASDHTWGLDAAPLVIIVCSTLIRGCCILLAIAIRAHLLDQIRPTRTRDATEVDTVMAMDADDDSPIIFDLARA
ncbi:unnamed protein product [Angiostrongylus costaricensis]|uniref:Sodium-and chloride-dependent glycine transporter 1 n=1 Tax=Angiostrongylus costaricensis TaxID=334426 RepID=A0A158PGN8_ANGCS|nr:unnamed protein product [Angiostrongylus costaricensis]